jgi:hypothetical protein
MPKAILEDFLELSLEELSAVCGAQSTQRTPADEFSDQLETTVKSWRDLLAPILAPAEETAKLAYATDRYLKFAYEHQYPALSQAYADKVNQDKADQAKHEQEERDAALSGNTPTNAAQVAAWLDSTAEPPAPPIEIAFPTYLTEPAHEATISIEPLDYSGGGGLY